MQVSDVDPRAMGAGAAIRPAQPPRLHNVSDGDLADEHRGQSFAKKRAAERLEAIEAELDRRRLPEAKGKLGAVTRYPSDGLIDLARLRADHPELVRQYAKPGTGRFWRSRTLKAEERA